MKPPTLLQRIVQGGVVFDGAMGSLLMARGLGAGTPPEAWNRERAEVVADIHTAYLDAGAQVIETNTFGGNPARLAAHARPAADVSLNADALRLARRAVAHGPDPDGRFVAFSLGPTGIAYPPIGAATDAVIRDAFEAQLRAAASAPPPDLVLIETMYDLREALAALGAVRAVFPHVPVAVTLTFSRTPRGFFTVMGDAAAPSFERLVAARADVVGANCTLGSGDMVAFAEALRARVSAPLLVQPNAGAPEVTTSGVTYRQQPESFARDVSRMFEAGVNAVGGCCGTTPAFIAAITKRQGEA